jgi:homoaconitase/3-isopropylmalate dehydratase large subunit
MGIASFMILEQLQIAPAIVTITYACLMGSAALGLALAFGLGGREVASRLLENTYQKGVQNADSIKYEAKLAKVRAKDSTKKATQKISEQ